MKIPIHSEATLVNGSTGDPVLYVDYPDRNNALLFDAGDVAALPKEKLADLDAVFLTHHHADHFMDLDRVVRANLDSSKTLNIYGPEGTIDRVYNRIKSYAHSYFPFQDLTLELSDLYMDRVDSCSLHYQQRFPPPHIVSKPYCNGGVIFENATVEVRAAATFHTVPGFAYSLREKSGYRLDFQRLRKTSLRPGEWVGQVLRYLSEADAVRADASRADEQPSATIKIEGGEFSLAELAKRFFRRSGGFQLVWMVDTILTDSATAGGLRTLAEHADRLYCDCFYAAAQSSAAAKHRHLTTLDAANFAIDCQVQNLFLVHFSPRYAGNYERLRGEVEKVLEGQIECSLVI